MIQILAGLGCMLAAALWGFAFVVVKDSLNDVSASYMVAIRFTIASIVMGIIFWKRIKKINLNYIKMGSLIGVFVFGGYFVQTIGCNYTTPGKNAFFTTVYVVLIPLYGWIVYKKRPAWIVFVATALQLIGIGFLSLGKDIKNGMHLNLGDWLTILCGVFYCFQMFYQAHFSKRNEEKDPFIYAFVQFVVTAILAWIISPFYNADSNAFTLNLQKFPAEAFYSNKFIASVLYLALGSTAAAFSLQNIGLKYLNSALATILLSCESVFGMLFSILIPINGVRETLSFWGIIGCVLIFTAVILAQLEEK